MKLKCRWVTYGGGTWHTTLDSEVSGIYIALNEEPSGFALIHAKPLPLENELIAVYPELKLAKVAAKQYFIDHLAAELLVAQELQVR